MKQLCVPEYNTVEMEVASKLVGVAGVVNKLVLIDY